MPEQVTLDLSKSVPLNPVQLDLSKSVPLNAPSTAVPNAEIKPSSWLSEAMRSGRGMVQDAVEGIGSGVLSTGLHAIDLARRMAGKETMLDTPQAQQLMAAPDSTVGRVAKGAEQVWEFLLPEVAGFGKVREAITAAKTASLPAKVASILGRSGLEAGVNAGISLAQTGDPETAKTNAAVSAVLGGLGAAAEQPLIDRATKMEAAALKPSLAITKSVSAAPGEGAKELAQNVFKYDLGGSLKDTAAKTIDAIRTRANQLNDLLQAQPVTYNLHDAIDQTEKELLGSMQGRAKNATFVSEVESAIAKFRADADKIAPEASHTIQVPEDAATAAKNNRVQGIYTMPQKVVDSPAGEADLLSANGFKRSVGHETNFEYGQRSRESQGIELVANSLYSKLRQGIEDTAGQAGPQIKQVNKELGELIPIERAVVRRLPIDYRQNMISLGTAMTALPALASGDLRELALPLAYHASKSPAVANALQKAATAAPGISGKVVSGLNDQQ